MTSASSGTLLRRTTLLLTTLSAWAAEAADPSLTEPLDFFPADEVLWPVVRGAIVGSVFVGLAVLAGLVAATVWLALVKDNREDRRPRPALIDRNMRVVEGPVLTGGDWVRTVEFAGGRRRVEVLSRGGWRTLEGDPLRHMLALDAPPSGPRAGAPPVPGKS